MKSKTIYAVTGLFSEPDAVVAATNAVYEAGYRKFDVSTPYPLHGIDKPMRLKPSIIAYIALVLGLTGASLGLFFMWWTNSVSYPLVIGGKPFFALPAFIPVAFELTVLFAAIGTTLVMLIVFFKFPNNSHPLHDTDYMRAVSCDKYGISIEAADGLFDESKARELLEKLGAANIETIYYNDEETGTIRNVLNPRFIIFILLVCGLTAGGVYFGLNRLAFMPPFSWMTDQERSQPGQKSEFFADGFSMRQPPSGTVARGKLPDMIESQEKAKFILNPLLPEKEVLDVGKRKYNTFCSPCHDYFGKGESRLKGQFPNPPSIHSERVRNWTDGDLFYVIAHGQNSMPSYSRQMNADEMWAVVHYIRALQDALNAKEEIQK